MPSIPNSISQAQEACRLTDIITYSPWHLVKTEIGTNYSQAQTYKHGFCWKSVFTEIRDFDHGTEIEAQTSVCVVLYPHVIGI
jgi:hypothetical protein